MSITRTLRVGGCAAIAGTLLFMSAPMALADQVRDDQWPLQAFKAEEIWKVSTGKGVTVAVIDDGVYAQHQDLKGNVLAGRDFIDGGSAEPESGENHGTAMSSLIAGHGHGPGGSLGVKGLAPDAKILPIRDDGLKGKGFAPSIRYAVDKGASVINISQGGSAAPNGVEPEAIAYALKHDVMIVAGSGNDGKGPGYEVFPAQYPGVVAVGGVSKTGKVWEGSNYGPHIMLTAPATRVVSAGGESATSYRMGTGTSDATAYVSAALALLRAEFPDLTGGQLLNRLVKTAGHPDMGEGVNLPDDKYGYGFIQPLAALKRDIPAGPPNGPLKTPDVSSSPSPSSGTDDATAGADDNASGETDSGDSDNLMPILLGVAGIVVVVAVIVVVMLVVRGKRRGGPPSPPTGGWGPPQAPGFPSQQPPPRQPPTPPGLYSPPPPPPPYRPGGGQ